MVECEPNYLEFHDIAVRGETIFHYVAPEDTTVYLVLVTETGERHRHEMCRDTSGEYRLALFLSPGRYFTFFEVNGERRLNEEGVLSVLSDRGCVANVLTVRPPSQKLTLQYTGSSPWAVELVADAPFVSAWPQNIVLKPGQPEEVIVSIDLNSIPEGISFSALHLKDPRSGKNAASIPIYCEAGYAAPHIAARGRRQRTGNECCVEIRKFGPGPLTCYVLDRTTCTVRLVEFTNPSEWIAETEAVTFKETADIMLMLKDQPPVVVMVDAPNPEDRIIVPGLHAGSFSQA